MTSLIRSGRTRQTIQPSRALSWDDSAPEIARRLGKPSTLLARGHNAEPGLSQPGPDGHISSWLRRHEIAAALGDSFLVLSSAFFPCRTPAPGSLHHSSFGGVNPCSRRKAPPLTAGAGVLVLDQLKLLAA